MDNYNKGKLLGKGSFGSAWLCVSKQDGKNYVIKEVDTSRMPKAERDAAEQEAKLLMALKHPNIVRCKECFTSASKLCIVMDWCSEGDLYGILQKRKGQPLPEDTVLDWFVQICLGLKHVHDRKILHRDLKSQNIFVSAGGLLKLGDFGVSKVLNSTFALATTAVGTPYYLSPEICQNRKYNQKSDMWSLGCVLYEMATMRQAFEAPNMRALIQKIIKGAYNPLPPSRSPELRALIASLLVLDARKRPGINDILAMPVVRQRIARFLNQTLQVHEFSHTVIHGKPQPGHLVVALQLGAHKDEAAAAAAVGGEVQAAAAEGRIKLSAPPAVGLAGKLAVAPKPAVPRLSGPAVRQQAAAAVAKNPIKSTSKEQLLGAAGMPPKPPSRAVSPSPAAAGAAGRPAPLQVGPQQQQQRSPLVSPKISPRAPSPRDKVPGLKIPSPRGDKPAASGGALVAGVKLPSPRGDRSAGVKLPSPREKAAGPTAAAAGGGMVAADAVGIAVQRAQQAQQQRQAMLKDAEVRRAADADAAKQAAERAYQQRQAAAAAAAAEVARMRAADEKAAVEAAAARAAAEKRKAEARQQDVQRWQQEAQAKQQKAEADAAAKKAAEEAKVKARAQAAAQKQAADDARAKARLAAEAAKRQAAAEARERERELMYQQMQMQKEEFLQRQKAAAANRQRAEEDMHIGVPPLPAAAAAAALVAEGGVSEVPSAAAVAAARLKQQRKAWVPVGTDEPRSDAADAAGVAGERAAAGARRSSEVDQPVGGRRAAAAAAGDELSAAQRRQVWEEMHAAAQRNKQQLQAHAQGAGLAAFLGLENDEQQQQKALQQHPQLQQQPRQQCGDVFQQQQQQLQGAAVKGDRCMPAACTSEADIDEDMSPLERRRLRLQAEQAARDAQLKEFQRQHWLEVKAAAARNKQQVMGELGIGKQNLQQQQNSPLARPLSPSSPQQQPPGGLSAPAAPLADAQQQQAPDAAAVAALGSSEDEEGEEEFAAMVADMQDLVLLSEEQRQQQQQQQQQEGGGSGAQRSDVSRETSEEYADANGTEALVVAGRFVLDGQEVQLPVASSDSLGLKVEALRMYLEVAMGTKPFLQVYHKLESLAAEDSEEQISQEFLDLLGPEKLRYMQLVHQLIIAEEKMHIEQMV